MISTIWANKAVFEIRNRIKNAIWWVPIFCWTKFDETNKENLTG